MGFNNMNNMNDYDYDIMIWYDMIMIMLWL